MPVCQLICLSVGRFTQKLVEEFSSNFVNFQKRFLAFGQEIFDYIFTLFIAFLACFRLLHWMIWWWADLFLTHEIKQRKHRASGDTWRMQEHCSFEPSCAKRKTDWSAMMSLVFVESTNSKYPKADKFCMVGFLIRSNQINFVQMKEFVISLDGGYSLRWVLSRIMHVAYLCFKLLVRMRIRRKLRFLYVGVSLVIFLFQ